MITSNDYIEPSRTTRHISFSRLFHLISSHVHSISTESTVRTTRSCCFGRLLHSQKRAFCRRESVDQSSTSVLLRSDALHARRAVRVHTVRVQVWEVVISQQNNERKTIHRTKTIIQSMTIALCQAHVRARRGSRTEAPSNTRFVVCMSTIQRLQNIKRFTVYSLVCGGYNATETERCITLQALERYLQSVYELHGMLVSGSVAVFADEKVDLCT